MFTLMTLIFKKNCILLGLKRLRNVCHLQFVQEPYEKYDYPYIIDKKSSRLTEVGKCSGIQIYWCLLPGLLFSTFT